MYAWIYLDVCVDIFGCMRGHIWIYVGICWMYILVIYWVYIGYIHIYMDIHLVYIYIYILGIVGFRLDIYFRCIWIYVDIFGYILDACWIYVDIFGYIVAYIFGYILIYQNMCSSISKCRKYVSYKFKCTHTFKYTQTRSNPSPHGADRGVRHAATFHRPALEGHMARGAQPAKPVHGFRRNETESNG